MKITKKVKKEKTLKPSNLFLGLILLFAACDDVRLHTFREVQNGWLATDTIEYKYINHYNDTLHNICIQLRCTPTYPVRELWLQMELKTNNSYATDTICCEIFDSLGRQQGSSAGLLHQTSHISGTYNIQPGDTATITITHLMNSPVNGVSDIGIKVCGHGRHQF